MRFNTSTSLAHPMNLKPTLSSFSKDFWKILSEPTDQLRLTSVILNTLAAIGFALQSRGEPTADLRLLLYLLPWYCWVCFFFGIALGRFSLLMGFIPSRGPFPVFASLGAIFCWVLLFLGVCSSAPVKGLTILYLVPCLMESLFLAHDWLDYKERKEQ